MFEEMELKLALEPEDLGRLRRNPLVRSHAGGRAGTRRLHSTYYDTPARDLRRRGMALRVRRVGKQLVQTLKVPVDGLSGLQHTREYEAVLSSEAPALDRVEDEALRRLFAEQNIAERLEPVFTTAFDRSRVPIRMAESEFELALDKGEITAGGARLPICEAELELISGRPDRIYQFALALRERIRFRLEPRTKPARGYGLAGGAKPAAARAEPLQLAPEMTVGQALHAAVRNCLKQVRANEAPALGGDDPEGVHQFRVGVRRLRALLSAFKPVLPEEVRKDLRGELSWLQDQFAPAREWDVFATETLRPLSARLPQEPGLAALAEEVEAARRDAYRQVEDTLAGRRYTELLLRLEIWLESLARRSDGAAGPLDRPIGPFADRVLDKRARQLRKAADKRHELSEAELHDVRILAKKLRYPIGFFRALYPKKAVKAHAAALSALQDRLGALNDAVVGEALLLDLEARMAGREPEDPCEAVTAVAIVRGWQAAQIEHDLAGFARAWSDFAALAPFWSSAKTLKP